MDDLAAESPGGDHLEVGDAAPVDGGEDAPMLSLHRLAPLSTVRRRC